jgi:hypothetical protein
VHIRNKNGRLYHITEIHTGFLQYILQVMHHLMRFLLDIFIPEFPANGIQTNLSGNIKGIACKNGLVIGADGGRGIGGFNDGLTHGFMLVMQRI